MTLSELEVLIVDCQTTGATPALGSIFEIAWCLVTPSEPELRALQAHHIALPEGQIVPAQVRRLTGFDVRARSALVDPEQAWRELRACFSRQPMPTAIHFARFEVGFLTEWWQRFEPELPFPLAPLCVHAVARRLYPELPRRSLRALAGFLGHGLELRRNALGHVQATAFIWRKLSAELTRRGLHDFGQIEAWLAAPAAAAHAQNGPRKKRRYPLPSERYKSLPDRPGVYQFLRCNGDILYIGKAASLKKRVTSHFAARSTREHSVEMLTQVSDVQVTLTATALEAALLENERIKAARPPYNVQLTGYDRSAWFAARNFGNAVSVPDIEHRIGPVPNPASLVALEAQIAVCAAAPAAARLRAQAVGAAERWAPPESVFAMGLGEFMRKHSLVPELNQAAVRRALLRAAKLLLAQSRTKLQPEQELEETEEPQSSPAHWDPERVTRHLERALSQSYQLLRRAMWLQLLQDCAIVYREPGMSTQRLLRLQAGELVFSADIESALPIEPPPRLRGRRVPAPMLRGAYDRLRILSSELKRIRRDGGDVSVYVAPARQLSERILNRVLVWI